MRDAAVETLLKLISCILLGLCLVAVLTAALASSAGWLVLAGILFVLAVFFSIWARRV